MAFVLLVVCIVIQIGLGTFILFRDLESWPHRVLAMFMLISSLISMHTLVRLVATDPAVAAALVVIDVVVAVIWNATGIVMSVIAVFYPSWISRSRFWTVLVPLGVMLVGAFVVVFFFGSIGDKTDIITMLPGTNVYVSDDANFQVRTWALIYGSICVLISARLLIGVIVRRPDAYWRSAIWLLVAILLVGVAVFVIPRWWPRYELLRTSLSSALLALLFGYIIVRHRPFSARDVAVGLAFDRLGDGVVILQPTLVVHSCNQSAADLLGVSRQFLVNSDIDTILQSSRFPAPKWHELWRIAQDGLAAKTEAEYELGSSVKTIASELVPIQDNKRYVWGYVWILNDTSEQRANEREIQQRQIELQSALRELRATNEAQRELLETIRTLSAPAVPVLPGIIVLPLSGQVNSDRARLIMGNLLSGIRDYDAKVAIMDITGVPHVDTQVAGYLIQAARAGALMGCRSILVGIRPEIAQVIVELGIDMQGLRTFSDLQSGVEYALRILDMALESHTRERPVAAKR